MQQVKTFAVLCYEPTVNHEYMVPEEDHPLWNLDAWHQLTRCGGEGLCWGH